MTERKDSCRGSRSITQSNFFLKGWRQNDPRSGEERNYPKVYEYLDFDDEDGWESYHEFNSDEKKCLKDKHGDYAQLVRKEHVTEDRYATSNTADGCPHRVFKRGDLERYEKNAVFQKSRFGNIRIGIDRETNDRVVIKECYLELVRNFEDIEGRRTLEHVEEEIKIHEWISSAQKSCKYIIKLLDVVYDEDFLYLILEDATEGELGQYLRHRNEEITFKLRSEQSPKCLRDWWEDSRRFMTQLLEAVGYLHENNICHRDLSVENIVLDRYVNIKVIDFGLAHRSKGDVMNGLPRVGKIRYMSPECWKDNQKYDGRDNDMWSLGVILFQMLFVDFPWELPSGIDKDFKRVHGKQGGTMRLLRKRSLLGRAPSNVLDMFDRIFRPQKTRITAKNGLLHPFITKKSANDIEPYYEDIGAALPDEQLESHISKLRYSQELRRPPSIWQKLNLKTRDEIQKFIALEESSLYSSTVYDKRFVEKFSNSKKEFDISRKQARQILAWFYAANRDRAELEPELWNDQANAQSDSSSWLDDDVKHDSKRRGDRSPPDRPPQISNGAPKIWLPVQHAQESSYQDNWHRTPIGYSRSRNSAGSATLSADTDRSSVNIIDRSPYGKHWPSNNSDHDRHSNHRSG